MPESEWRKTGRKEEDARRRDEGAGWAQVVRDGSEREKSRSEKESRYLSFSLAEEAKREGG